jgi:hypothetical protein
MRDLVHLAAAHLPPLVCQQHTRVLALAQRRDHAHVILHPIRDPRKLHGPENLLLRVERPLPSNAPGFRV